MTVVNPQIIQKNGSMSERHRPKRWEEMCGQTQVISSLRDMLARYKQRGEIPPHLLFKGPSGTGKTTAAYIFAEEYLGGIKRDYNFFEFNGSDARKIDDVRNKIKPLTTISTKIIIFVSEADRLTDESQAALRRITETTKNALFIFDLNEENKIIDAMKSRCAEFTFTPLDDNTILTRVYQIFDAEGIKYTMEPEEEHAMLQIVHTSRGDMRKIFTNIEKVLTADKQINPQNILELNTSINSVAEVVKSAIAGDFDKAKNLIEDAYIMSGYKTDMLLDGFTEALSSITDNEIRIWAYVRLAEMAHRLESTHRPLVILWGYVGELWRAPHLRKS